MVSKSELENTLALIFGFKNEDESLISQLGFIGVQLERIANELEKRNRVK